MALRSHLILTPAVHSKGLAEALAGAEASPVATAGAWAWCAASPWSKSHAELRERLVDASCPFLLFTPFDGDGWRLSASDGADHAGEALHEFADDWGKGSKGRDERLHRIVELLRVVARDADPAALRKALEGVDLTDEEAGSDLGDLARILALIGAGNGILPAAEPAVPRRRAPRPTTAAALLRHHEQRPCAGLEGVALPVGVAADLAWLALYCDPEAQLALVASGRGLDKPRLDMPHTAGVLRGDLVVEADGGAGLKANVIEQAARHFAGQAGLDGLILVSGRRRGAGVPVGWHRYAGPVEGGIWRVAQTTPPVTPGALIGALGLIGQRRGEGPIECLSQEEAAAIAARCEGSLYLGPGRGPRVAGASLIPAKDTRAYVLMECFRHRFAAVWDSAEARRLEASENRRWQRLIERAGRG